MVRLGCGGRELTEGLLLRVSLLRGRVQDAGGGVAVGRSDGHRGIVLGRFGGGSIACDVRGGLFGGGGCRRLGGGFGPDNLPKGGVNLFSCRMTDHAIARLLLLIGDVGNGDGGGGRVGGAMPHDLPEGAVHRCSCRMTKDAVARLMRIDGGGSIGGGVFGGLFGGLVLRAHPCDLPKGGVNRCGCRVTNNATARLMLEGGGDGSMLGFGGSMLGNGGGVRVGLFGGEGGEGDGLGGGTMLCGQPDGVPKGVINPASHGSANHALARLGLGLERSRRRVGIGHRHRQAGAEGEP